ncbi:leucine-rich repeat-containing protein 39 isoform X1 [Gadus macrocephalus]|uniref:leucine-rich repeat-containing protein 39 isoform X1 n=1 Tax=Gadus macrocephalus TaxID=80720 RepID=UPI0028CB451F|nr:leucine-rich repeat-containing protein 39 isoform X1 [Gadus macrocephalus]XP_059924070.1 leucine-rich repeat-containing protein 39 isoform X1 [Gadus macrocephalus]XP_059924071.1 leucine-rich repeat-containing protein 39 isoform X1 [Gadus macrocephalus]XP_059924072.1 leucine-rich repeat-containing protein 39 isoform X1 [Gadus macrocephalus]
MSGFSVRRGSVGSIKALWEGRILKNQEEVQRPKPKDQDGLNRLSDVWENRIVLAKLKEKLVNEDGRLIFRLEKEEWKTLPQALVHLTQVQEWQIHRTGLQSIPNFICRFEHVVVLDLSRNAINVIPREIGLFYLHPGEMRRLRELLLSYNQLKDIPEELGRCENLERLELAMNGNLSDLPSELSQLKKLCYLDLSMNRFLSLPECVVGLAGLQWLDMGGNHLQGLPADIHRMGNLHTLWLQRNELKELPENLSLLQSLETLVLSNNRLRDIPAQMEGMANLRFVNFRDNPLTLDVVLFNKTQQEEGEDEDREMFGREFMHMYIQEARRRDMMSST